MGRTGITAILPLYGYCGAGRMNGERDIYGELAMIFIGNGRSTFQTDCAILVSQRPDGGQRMDTIGVTAGNAGGKVVFEDESFS